MKLIEFVGDEEAVSPVIGVILMVAITVILAAVIGTFVLGLGDQVSETAPQASFSFDYNGANQIVITHESGESVNAENVNITGSAVSGAPVEWGTGDITAGDTQTITTSSNPLSGGEEVRIVWTSQSGSTSATLQKWTYNG